MNKKKFFGDAVLNIISTLLPTVVLQFIIMPIISKGQEEASFGIIISLMSFLNIVKSIFGNSLNNTTLLENEKYVEKNISGDFNIYLLISLGFDLALMFVITFIYSDFNWLNIVIFVTASLFMIAVEYASVEYRLILSYKKVFFSNIFLTVGYLIGLLIYYFTNYYQFIFIFGPFINFIYVFLSTKILKANYHFTPIKFKTLKTLGIFVLSATVSSLVGYFDRIFILPVLGGENTTYYYISTLITKTVTTGINPIMSVILSYIVVVKMLRFKTFLKAEFVALLCSIPMIGIMYGGSLLVVKILYSNYMDIVKPYLLICVFIGIFDIIRLINNPFFLRYCKKIYFLLIQIINLILYCVFGLVLSKSFGLMGYCYGMLMSNAIICALTVILTIITIKRQNNKLIKLDQAESETNATPESINQE